MVIDGQDNEYRWRKCVQAPNVSTKQASKPVRRKTTRKRTARSRTGREGEKNVWQATHYMGQMKNLSTI